MYKHTLFTYFQEGHIQESVKQVTFPNCLADILLGSKATEIVSLIILKCLSNIQCIGFTHNFQIDIFKVPRWLFSITN